MLLILYHVRHVLRDLAWHVKSPHARTTSNLDDADVAVRLSLLVPGLRRRHRLLCWRGKARTFLVSAPLGCSFRLPSACC